MKKIIAMCLILLVFGREGVALAATTDSTNVTAGITGGSFAFSNLPNNLSFPDIVLDGVNWQVSMASFDNFTVTDARGLNNGWKLSVSATQFTEVGGKGIALPPGTLVVYAPLSVSQASGTTSALPTISGGYGLADDQPFEIATAPDGTGMGTFVFGRIYLEIDIRPGAIVVDNVNYPAVPTPYSSTLTWSMVSGP